LERERDKVNVVIITIIRLFMAYHQKKEKKTKIKKERSISFEKERRQFRSAELSTYP
jgi:hypothetical protein